MAVDEEKVFEQVMIQATAAFQKYEKLSPACGDDHCDPCFRAGFIAGFAIARRVLTGPEELTR